MSSTSYQVNADCARLDLSSDRPVTGRAASWVARVHLMLSRA